MSTRVVKLEAHEIDLGTVTKKICDAIGTSLFDKESLESAGKKMSEELLNSKCCIQLRVLDALLFGQNMNGIIQFCYGYRIGIVFLDPENDHHFFHFFKNVLGLRDGVNESMSQWMVDQLFPNGEFVHNAAVQKEEDKG